MVEKITHLGRKQLGQAPRRFAPGSPLLTSPIYRPLRLKPTRGDEWVRTTGLYEMRVPGVKKCPALAHPERPPCHPICVWPHLVGVAIVTCVPRRLVWTPQLLGDQSRDYTDAEIQPPTA